MAKNNGGYLFPNTLETSVAVFHYSRRLHASFVSAAKADIAKFTSKFKTAPENRIHIYIYPDVKTFISAMGGSYAEVEKRENRKIIGGNQLESRYIIRAEDGSIHMVLPTGRLQTMYTNFTSEIIVYIMDDYVSFTQKQRYEMKASVRAKLKRDKAEEEKKKQDELDAEEEEKRKAEEEEEKERLEEEARLAAEEEEQLRLEALEDEKKKEALDMIAIEEALLSEDEIGEVVDIAEKIDNVDDKEQPEWLKVGFAIYMSKIIENSDNKQSLKDYVNKTGKTKFASLAQGKLKKDEYFKSWGRIKYIVSAFGYKKLNQFMDDPENYSIFSVGMSKQKFDRESKMYTLSLLDEAEIAKAIEKQRDKEKDKEKEDKSRVKLVGITE